MVIQTGTPCKWTNDSQRFLLEFFDIIRASPSQVYCFALPFCPPTSWLHKYYTTKLLQVVKVVQGVPVEWGMCSRTVVLDTVPLSSACWNNTIVVGTQSGRIIFLDRFTGSQLASLSEHTGSVRSLAFSSDGTLLVSGSHDETIILWDVQTGGVVKSFCGHTHWVVSVSISPDQTTIVSGSHDNTIRLWDIQTGKCHCIMDIHEGVNSVSFSPTNSQLLLSASNGHTIQQWDTNGHPIGPTYRGSYAAFSLDGTCFISWRGGVAMVRNSHSGAAITEIRAPSNIFQYCCFSPNGNLVAGSTSLTIYVWDITGTDPRLIKTLIGHTQKSTSLTFSSSLISASEDRSVKFWQVTAPPTDSAITNAMPAPPPSGAIESVSLQARDGVAVSSDSDGLVKTWDIMTGLCTASFQTPAKGRTWRGAQLIEGRLILVWHKGGKTQIWDTKKGELLQMVDTPLYEVNGLRISGDGTKIFYLSGRSILAWSMWTGEVVGKVELKDGPYLDPLYVDGSRIWTCFKDLPTQGWDFGTPGSPPTQLINTSSSRPRLDFILGSKWQDANPDRVVDTVTGENIFQLCGGYTKPHEVQWDGRYLIAGYKSGRVLILDFNDVLP